ncbi:MAG: [NiFe]-hydrogenase assembly chaperone HybE [Burkholderiales bacterium]|nr:[NiFe]-hydrogenase assembly chaperone HybE [Burkholderiales bacterium]
MRPDPSPRLVDFYRVAAARMQGLDVVNCALEVEAIGFAPWKDHWLGVLLTPWFMNLVLAPRDPERWVALATGVKRLHAFPAGDFEFIGACDDVLGDYAMCSLFSPVREFADQPTARLVAQHARVALLDAENAERAAPNAEGPIAGVERRLEQPVSRRDLLRGRLGATGDEPRR